MSKNRQLRVKAWPKSLPGPEHFKIVEALVPTPRDAEVLIRNLWLSIDPYYRQSLGPRFVGTPFCHPGDVMMSVTLGQVIESRDPAVPVGRYVTTLLGKMQDFAVVSGRAVRLLPDDIFGDGPGRLPLSTALGVAGIPGLTAYATLTPPREFDTRRDIRRFISKRVCRCSRRSAGTANGLAHRRHCACSREGCLDDQRRRF
jgi:NADPH-dependent curcumin reductase CurA